MPESMPDPRQDPHAILARGASRGIPVEDFGPVWTSARLRLSRAGWQAATLEPFLDLAVRCEQRRMPLDG